MPTGMVFLWFVTSTTRITNHPFACLAVSPSSK
jgi:hypothetical protein